MKLFAAGTAAVFGALYLYLFIRPAHIIPFLVFGASLKTWAFMLSLALYARGRLGTKPLLEFGAHQPHRRSSLAPERTAASCLPDA
jgi:hypothetical protein